MSNHYDADYFKWQKNIGEFGGWANLNRFQKYINPTDTVVDFGCGGGYLLKNLVARRKIGIEINEAAAMEADKNGIAVYADAYTAAMCCNNTIDVVISNNALEHVNHPLTELKYLRKCLKIGGTVVFYLPCESINNQYVPGDINNHLFSWSPMCAGNLFTQAGFKVVESVAHITKWPPNYLEIAKLGRGAFEEACEKYGLVEDSWHQVRVVATKE